MMDADMAVAVAVAVAMAIAVVIAVAVVVAVVVAIAVDVDMDLVNIALTLSRLRGSPSQPLLRHSTSANMKFIRESLAVLVLSHVEAAELRGRREPNLNGAQSLGSSQEGARLPCDICGDDAGCAVLSSHRKFCDKTLTLSNERACVSYTWTPTEWCKGTVSTRTER